MSTVAWVAVGIMLCAILAIAWRWWEEEKSTSSASLVDERFFRNIEERGMTVAEAIRDLRSNEGVFLWNLLPLIRHLAEEVEDLRERVDALGDGDG